MVGVEAIKQKLVELGVDSDTIEFVALLSEGGSFDREDQLAGTLEPWLDQSTRAFVEWYFSIKENKKKDTERPSKKLDRTEKVAKAAQAASQAGTQAVKRENSVAVTNLPEKKITIQKSKGDNVVKSNVKKIVLASAKNKSIVVPKKEQKMKKTEFLPEFTAVDQEQRSLSSTSNKKKQLFTSKGAQRRDPKQDSAEKIAIRTPVPSEALQKTISKSSTATNPDKASQINPSSGGQESGHPMKVRCRFWPNCSSGESCPYIHPTELCKFFATGSCKFGAQCLHIHSLPKSEQSAHAGMKRGFQATEHTDPSGMGNIPCKFGTFCKRPGCFYLHPKKSALDQLEGSSDNKTVCHFDPKCNRIVCPYLHPQRDKLQPSG